MQIPAPVEPVFHIYSLSEQAITVEFGKDINEPTFNRVTAFNRAVQQNPFPGFQTTVPAYTTVTVFFDAMSVLNSADLTGRTCFDKVSRYLAELKINNEQKMTSPVNIITIPVCYGGHFGPDLEEVAGLHNLTHQEVIDLHSAATYKVYMIGFVPGFAYLGGMDIQLATSRKPSPRSAIPPGSVGIAGNQTGVYPLETPGGWQIIGRTPLKMFNPNRPQPSLLKAGDQVVFRAIDEQEFDHLSNP